MAPNDSSALGSSSSSGEQDQLNRAISTGSRHRVGRLCGGGALIGAVILFILQKVLNGPIWGPIEVPDISLGGLVFLAALVGSIVLGSVGRFAAIISNSPALLHYLKLFEAWLLYRLRCMPPAQYHEHVTKLHHARLNGHLPPEARSTKRDTFVPHTLKWRMASEVRRAVKQKPKQQKPKQQKPKQHRKRVGGTSLH
ncbi:hypothetical protein [Archangium sp.]|uniref:hypothetical protein n=1 Tax=Archangium sp. TaxID=1872627 RepID=UPI002D2B7F7C|nr:hypothetical protein [Archangium sp.]HYO52258.1 hypothetical protein [Archangium sp.]